jgi:hypothetical protein
MSWIPPLQQLQVYMFYKNTTQTVLKCGIPNLRGKNLA